MEVKTDTGTSAPKPMVTIAVEEHEELLEDQRKLLALEGAGVDNWEGYDEAMRMLKEDS